MAEKKISSFINELLDDQLTEEQQCIVLNSENNLIGGDNTGDYCGNSGPGCAGNNKNCTNSTKDCYLGNNYGVCSNTGINPPTNGMVCK